MELQQIDTPALVVDVERLEHNVATMAEFFAGRPAALRPHFKTPKCAEVVRLQLDAGALGITCAKLGEIEALADAGVATSVLLANQVVGAAKVGRLIALAARLPELLFAVDHADQIAAVEAALAPGAPAPGGLVEVDVGMLRCGTDTPEQTVALARRLSQGPLPYRGVMGYEGHAVLVPDEGERKQRATAAMSRLQEHVRALQQAGLAPAIVSAGGTGTYDLTGGTAGVTEIQAGSYVFMDGAYRRVRREFECALTLLCTVIHRRGRTLITDAGMKALSHEFGLPRGFDLPVACTGLSEEHGHVAIDEGHELDLAPGDRLRLLPSHGDTTINLHERYYAVRGTRVEGVWPIIGRGKFV